MNSYFFGRRKSGLSNDALTHETSRNRRCFSRFHTKTMLASIAVLSVALFFLRSAKNRHDVAQAIKSRGATVLKYEFHKNANSRPPNWHGWLPQNMEVDYFYDITAVRLPCYLSKKQPDLEDLQSLSALESVEACDSIISDATISCFSGHQRLVRLDLSGCKITGKAFANLTDVPNLQYVVLSGTDVDDSLWKYLRGFPDLKDLDLFGTRVTGETLSCKSHFPKLRRIDLGETRITDAGLSQIACVTSLETLSLDGAYVSDSGLAAIRALLELRELDLTGTCITDEGLSHLLELEKINRIYLAKTRVTSEGARWLKREIMKRRSNGGEPIEVFGID